jgi:glucose/arabinose dehydrogenase
MRKPRFAVSPTCWRYNRGGKDLERRGLEGRRYTKMPDFGIKRSKACFAAKSIYFIPARYLSIRFAWLIIASAFANAGAQTPGVVGDADVYTTNCSGCHGPMLTGGEGPSLIAQVYLHGTSDVEVERSIRDGYPDRHMPSWGDVLPTGQIEGLVRFIRQKRADNSPESLAALDAKQIRKLPTETVGSELESFRLHVVATLGKTFGLAVLPDDRVLVTETAGALRIIEHGHLLPAPVTGTPHGQPTDLFKRVLLDLAVHPAYAHNGWIYLTCGDSAPGPDGQSTTEVKLVRGHLQGNAWMDTQVLAHLPINTATARIAFDRSGHVFLSTSSEPGETEARQGRPFTVEQLLAMSPQSLGDPHGKILRYNDDGSVPSDNPFAGSTGAFAPIWSYGHRNPQGLAFDAHTGTLWSSEQGPRGGDELNLIRGGHNYGFPVISYSSSYNGVSFTTEIEHTGMDQPVINWTPDIAVSAITFYEGAAFPKWRHDLLIGALKSQELSRVVLDGERVIVQESLLKGLGRIRSIAVASNGDIYFALELRTQTLVVRMTP